MPHGVGRPIGAEHKAEVHGHWPTKPEKLQWGGHVCAIMHC